MRKYYISFLAALILMLTACVKQQYRTAEGTVWNTFYHISYNSDKDLSDSVQAVLRRVELSVSAFNRASIVSRINRNEVVEPDSCFVAVYTKAREICEASAGAFDPTLAPLINAYGFGYKDSVHVTRTMIDSIRQFVGIDKTRIEGSRLIKDDPRIEFNFSALAKGYGCDMVAAMLRRNGVTDFMVEIGGEIAVGGVNESGEKWQIGIDSPHQPAGEISAVLPVTNCGIATSGNYRNYREKEGKRIGHTIDPATGLPAETDILSATIVAPTTMEADALATACMAMGSRKALPMIEKMQLPAMFILAGDSVLVSSAWPK